MKPPPQHGAGPFRAIAKGEIEAHRVREDDCLVAFLDRGPIRAGQIQIIPAGTIPVSTTFRRRLPPNSALPQPPSAPSWLGETESDRRRGYRERAARPVAEPGSNG